MGLQSPSVEMHTVVCGVDVHQTLVVVAPMDSRNSRAMTRSSPSRTKLRLRKSISTILGDGLDDLLIVVCKDGQVVLDVLQRVG